MAHPTAFVDDVATTPSTNVYALKARNLKAGRLADVLILHGATAAQAAALPTEARTTVAALAGTRLPSPTTWDLVVELVACVERTRALSPLVERLDDARIEAELFARL